MLRYFIVGVYLAATALHLLNITDITVSAGYAITSGTTPAGKMFISNARLSKHLPAVTVDSSAEAGPVESPAVTAPVNAIMLPKTPSLAVYLADYTPYGHNKAPPPNQITA